MSVYLLTCPPFVEGGEERVKAKIGRTSLSADHRASAFQTGNPDLLTVCHEVCVVSPSDAENRLHKFFKEYGGPFASSEVRSRLSILGGKEWFNVPTSILKEIKSGMDSLADLDGMRFAVNSAQKDVDVVIKKRDELEENLSRMKDAWLSNPLRITAKPEWYARARYAICFNINWGDIMVIYDGSIKQSDFIRDLDDNVRDVVTVNLSSWRLSSKETVDEMLEFIEQQLHWYVEKGRLDTSDEYFLLVHCTRTWPVDMLLKAFLALDKKVLVMAKIVMVTDENVKSHLVTSSRIKRFFATEMNLYPMDQRAEAEMDVEA